MAEPRVVVYPGSFDPLTLGHEDIARRCLRFADKLIVAVAVTATQQKDRLFTVEDRMEMIEECFADEPRVQVTEFSGLLVDFCKNEPQPLAGTRDGVHGTRREVHVPKRLTRSRGRFPGWRRLALRLGARSATPRGENRPLVRMVFLQKLAERAAESGGRVVLVEGHDERVRGAALRLREIGHLDPAPRPDPSRAGCLGRTSGRLGRSASLPRRRLGARPLRRALPADPDQEDADRGDRAPTCRRATHLRRTDGARR